MVVTALNLLTCNSNMVFIALSSVYPARKFLIHYGIISYQFLQISMELYDLRRQNLFSTIFVFHEIRFYDAYSMSFCLYSA